MIQALVFDFDGLILDTESVQFESWRRIYEQFGFELPLDRWLELIGTDTGTFEPAAHLESLVGRPMSNDELHEPRRRYRDELLNRLPSMEGVREYLDAAVQRELRLAIASGSPRDWVVPHLDRLKLTDYFERIATYDDVERGKPDPALFRLAVRGLGVSPESAVAFDDSPHGVASAKAAGLRCVAVPGPMTASLDFRGADIVLASLGDRTLAEVLKLLQEK
jgi:HAD superfamily hydrolase (TIGR01509 family)